MKEKSGQKLWNDFIETVKRPGTLVSYENYYSLVVKWINQNRNTIGEDLLNKYRLDLLMDLNPQRYVINDLDIQPLSTEIKRLGNFSASTREVIIIILKDILWDMVTIRSDEICPVCGSPDVRILIGKDNIKQGERLILNCETCVWASDVDGVSLSEGEVQFVPANKEDLIRLGQK